MVSVCVALPEADVNDGPARRSAGVVADKTVELSYRGDEVVPGVARHLLDLGEAALVEVPARNPDHGVGRDRRCCHAGLQSSRFLSQPGARFRAGEIYNTIGERNIKEKAASLTPARTPCAHRADAGSGNGPASRRSEPGAVRVMSGWTRRFWLPPSANCANTAMPACHWSPSPVTPLLPFPACVAATAAKLSWPPRWSTRCASIRSGCPMDPRGSGHSRFLRTSNAT